MAEFVALYGTTFFVVLTLHALTLAVLPMTWWATTAAWALSQAFGSTSNFLVLRLVIFRDRPLHQPDDGAGARTTNRTSTPG